MDLEGRHVLVTGASRGIGPSIAEAMASRGARLALVARSEHTLTEVAARTGGTVITADLTDPDALPEASRRSREWPLTGVARRVPPG